MREYEVMLILPAEADEKLVGTAVERVTKAIEPSGGTVDGIDRWGRRRFAFEIDDQPEGYYVVVAFTAEPTDIAAMERSLILADEVVRAKVTHRGPPSAASGRATRTAAARPEPVVEPAAASDPEPVVEPTAVTDPEPVVEPETTEESSPAPA